MAHVPPISQAFPSLDQSKRGEEEEERRRITNLVSTFPTVDGGTFGSLHRHPDGWYAIPNIMLSAMVARERFQARPTDVLLSTLPKSGTVWLKALIFATVHRDRHAHGDSGHPFATLNPHECVPFLEMQLYANGRVPDLDSLPAPRLFCTHIPVQSLPESIAGSGCRIVYLCRDAKDAFVSLWHFINKARGVREPIEEALDRFCEGVALFGPYWDHMLGYWRAHLERPDKVLFLRYEELKAEPVDQLRRLAEFVGCPFSSEEEERQVAEGIVRLCAIKNLSKLEVNKTGSTKVMETTTKNSFFFRRGVVGDWVNYLTPEMARRIDELTKSKFKGSGLTF